MSNGLDASVHIVPAGVVELNYLISADWEVLLLLSYCIMYLLHGTAG